MLFLIEIIEALFLTLIVNSMSSDTSSNIISDKKDRRHDSFYLTPTSSSSKDAVEIPEDYNFSKSTAENHAWPRETAGPPEFVGDFAALRKTLDVSYHPYYSAERQVIQDNILNRAMCRFNEVDTCDRLETTWLVFTAGTMGAGKGFVLDWLNKHKLFPLQSFVPVDPDKLRDELPETSEYIRRDAATAGKKTQREVGYLAEILTLQGLRSGKNVLVDGSLKDGDWYAQYIKRLKQEFPQLHIAILFVTATLDTVLLRVEKRGAKTGRVVPRETVLQAQAAIPRSVESLAPYVDLVAAFDNDDSVQEPTLRLLYRHSLVQSTPRKPGLGLRTPKSVTEERDGDDMGLSTERSQLFEWERDSERALSVADLSQFYVSSDNLQLPRKDVTQSAPYPTALSIINAGSMLKGTDTGDRDRDADSMSCYSFASLPSSPCTSAKERRYKQELAASLLKVEDYPNCSGAVDEARIDTKDASRLPPLTRTLKSSYCASKTPTLSLSYDTSAHPDTSRVEPNRRVLPLPNLESKCVSECDIRMNGGGGTGCRTGSARDNQWWRAEFRDIFEVRCILPRSTSASATTAVGNSIQSNRENINDGITA